MSLPGRTTPALVRGINGEIGTDADLNPFIDAANELVTEKCTTSGYSNARLELIERWLSAHYHCVDSPRASRERVGSITVEPQGKVDIGLDNSLYGQMAMRLDTAGNLAAMNNAMKTVKAVLPAVALRRPGIRWMGTVPEETE